MPVGTGAILAILPAATVVAVLRLSARPILYSASLYLSRSK
jgi:hypothetical protein